MQRDKYGQTAQYGWGIDHIEDELTNLLTSARQEGSAPYWAHSANAHGNRHRLACHLASVSKLAREFLQGCKGAEEAALAGLLHDLGKYGDLFQARLRGEESGLDHWTAGAHIALLEHKAIAAALAIEGHHIGLQAASSSAFAPRMKVENLINNHPLNLRLSDPDFGRLRTRANTESLSFETPAARLLELNESAWTPHIARMLDVRMLFSCLVDADFLDTEAHFNAGPDGKRYRASGPPLNAELAVQALERFMAEAVRAKTASSAAVSDVRAKLWQAATAAAEAPTGLFSLTAPTGSGKTLAMLQFALAHAARNKLRRVVLAVPYLSIIEQTARIYSDVFSAQEQHFVLEHHSLAGVGDEKSKSDAEGKAHDDTERQRRLLSDNWDAPVVITTNVQLLQSLFSNRPSACRKLHNLLGSVILFDEAQTLPQHLAVPTLAALSHLSAEYRSSVVFATATQPAFDTLNSAVKKHAVSGWQPCEIVGNNRAMFEKLKRVEPEWPRDGEELDWPALAAQISRDDMAQVLCVVNLKRHAFALLKALVGVEGVLHLSTNLCTAHRRAVLEEVRARLDPGKPKPCRLISTQCVEAGVDLDFPVVYRAMAPLEAIAQAAGRCNREGRMSGLGRVKVFQPVTEGDLRRTYPTQAYYQAAEVTRSLLKEHGSLNIDDPDVFRSYYRRLYDVSRPVDRNLELNSSIEELDFPEIARRYRLIEQDAIQVVVPWSRRIEDYEALRAEAAIGIGRDWIAQAQALAVSVYRPKRDHPAWGVLVPARFRRGGDSDEWFVLEDRERKFYDDDTLGLQLPDAQQIMIA